jgi:hypothetical protein
MTDRDIVTRLRAVLHNDRSVELMNREAADEIERLREELTASHESHGNEVGALKEMLSLSIHERDEARRECCMARAAIRWDLEHPKSPNRSETTIILLAWQISNERGWDCFREHKP